MTTCLGASHIIPWSESIPRRADCRNGIALHALYDRAFYRGYLRFDKNLPVILSPALRSHDPPVSPIVPTFNSTSAFLTAPA